MVERLRRATGRARPPDDDPHAQTHDAGDTLARELSIWLGQFIVGVRTPTNSVMTSSVPRVTEDGVAGRPRARS